MKTRMYVVLVAYLILCSGCDQTSRQRLDMLEGIVQKGTEASALMGTQLDALKVSIGQMQAVLSDPNLAVPEREKIQELLSKAVVEIATVSAKKAEIDGYVATWKAKLAELKDKEVTLADELILYGQAASQFGPAIPAPVGPYITLAGIIAAAVGAAMAKKAKKVSAGVVRSVDALLASPVVTNQDEAKSILKTSQEFSGVREEVRKLL